MIGHVNTEWISSVLGDCVIWWSKETVNTEWISSMLGDCVIWWSKETVCNMDIHSSITEAIVWDDLLAFSYRVSFNP